MRRILVATGAVVLVNGVADAQTALNSGQQAPAESAPTYAVAPSATDATLLRSALDAARRGDTATLRNARMAAQDPLTRKIITWALADAAPEQLGFWELDAARRDLDGWPRAAKRQAAAEKLLSTAGLDPARTIAWFGGAEPTTAQGAISLASAFRAQGRNQEAATLIRRFWRDKVFELDAQRAMMARFSDVLTMDDHIRRADILLYGQQGPATREMVAMLPADEQAAAAVRIAFRAGASNANDLLAALTPAQQTSPGVAFERAAFLRKKGLDVAALGLVRYFPMPQTDEAESRVWTERKMLIISALRNNDAAGAYTAAANSGLMDGADAAEAEFYAGWLALSRLDNPELAGQHFARINGIGQSPITRSRGYYWQGRAAEAAGDVIGARAFYGEGAQYQTTFYGQLAGERAGLQHIVLGRDPVPTAADKARFESRELVRAARLMLAAGARDSFRGFVLYIDDILPNAEEAALLVDMARATGDQDLAMRAARAAAQRGFILPERGYPMINLPTLPAGSAENAFVFSIARQESNFDTGAISAPGARGLMQLMPGTASDTARKLGEGYSLQRLHEAEYNLRLGSRYLGQMIDRFSGSYIMAAAAYNAGPGRPPQWVAICGDPRGASTDPLDFIECIPFSETRNYVMRTLETMQVYRARINGGTAPLNLSADLKRGGYGSYAATQTASSSQ
ncbi:lytic transglycosylase domain-containing protein [Caulobacter sp. NIBR2454]|uniref:lytic transglycosylase domain-containing protein n=1 Tax=Caulobacter sp. NIBR2454 TaxID=3015996 RepID=UPI0022B61FEE|nr:lytic transglycosylase domain-containing protein [Caulobacter sp. NIBR2454]